MHQETQLNFKSFEEKQHFTQPPAHYTEAALVKTLEELGIGRPSTYAPTITTIINRRYVAKENKNLYMTELGEVVNQYYDTGISRVLWMSILQQIWNLCWIKWKKDVVNWKTVVSNFYPDLDEAVKACRERAGKSARLKMK
ncbi:MAG: DNA topoisomerase [Lachnospiraceae bacterium]